MMTAIPANRPKQSITPAEQPHFKPSTMDEVLAHISPQPYRSDADIQADLAAAARRMWYEQE